MSTPFEAYCAYVALHSHFTKPSYDYFKYSGQVTATPESFENRNDRAAFRRLSKNPDFERVILANFVYGDSHYIGDIATKKGTTVYTSWLKRIESLPYAFKQEMNLLPGSIVNTFEVYHGQHPTLLRMVAKGQVSIETLIILEDLSDFMKVWNDKIIDPVFWPELAMKCRKYRPFFTYDREKMKAILHDTLEERR